MLPYTYCVSSEAFACSRSFRYICAVLLEYYRSFPALTVSVSEGWLWDQSALRWEPGTIIVRSTSSDSSRPQAQSHAALAAYSP